MPRFGVMAVTAAIAVIAAVIGLMWRAAFLQYMREGPTRVGRPLLLCSVGQVGFGEFWRVPVDEGLIVAFMPGLDVADRVAALAEREVVVVRVNVRDDGSWVWAGTHIKPLWRFVPWRMEAHSARGVPAPLAHIA